MPYRELAMPDIMVRIATYVFETSKKLKEIFQSFDLNRDGYIGKDELVLGQSPLVFPLVANKRKIFFYEYGSSRHSHTFASDGSGPSRIKYYQFVNFLTDSKMVLTDSASDRHTAETETLGTFEDSSFRVLPQEAVRVYSFCCTCHTRNINTMLI